MRLKKKKRLTVFEPSFNFKKGCLKKPAHSLILALAQLPSNQKLNI
jgi:hypothetical protein